MRRRRLDDRRRLWLALAGISLTSFVSFAAGATPPLIDAIKHGDRVVLRQLLTAGAAVNAEDPSGMTALHWAIERDEPEVVDLLLGAGANARALTHYGVGTLTLAATNGNARIITALLRAGVDPDAGLPEGETALMTAARTGKIEAIDALLGGGANVNAVEGWRKQTALMWAAAEGNVATVKTLVAHGADVAARSSGGLTALLFAVRSGQTDVVRALLSGGASVSDKTPDGTSALVLAIINANYEAAALLLEKGADPNTPDIRGSALHAVAWMRRPGFPLDGSRIPDGVGTVESLDLARALLDAGADPNPRSNWKEIPFDREDAQVRNPPNISVGRNYLSLNGATPFFLAARGGDVDLMRLLVDYGADPTLGTFQNITPLMAAAGLGYWHGESPGPLNGVSDAVLLEAVKFTVEMGNDVNAVTNFGDVELERDGTLLLLRHPVNIDKVAAVVPGDSRWNGSTALHGAAVRDADTVVQYLADHGAKLDATNRLGWTPLMVAEGVFVSNTEKTAPKVAALLRKLLQESGAQRQGK